MTIRLIIQSTKNGESEYVTFTEKDSPIEGFLYPDHSVDIDKWIEADIPSCFPSEYSLKRV